MNDEVLIADFFRVGYNGDKTIKKSDLGWGKTVMEDAQSDDPETIFRYVVEIVGLNILFYWMEDRQWYTIETEKNPIEVRRIFPNPNWDGKCEMNKAGVDGVLNTSSAGEVIATFEDPTMVWEQLQINGVPISEVLANSVITDLD